MPTARSSDEKRDASFEELFARYAKGLLVYAREFVHTQEEAEDIVQDVFVRVWEKMDVLSGDTAGSYLFRSTRNGCLNYLERLGVRTRYQEETLEKGAPPDALEPELYVAAELRAHIEAAIAKLPPQQRRSFVLNKLEGKSYAEIGAELDISPRTVEKHVEMASKALREHLAEHLCLLLLAFLSSN